MRRAFVAVVLAAMVGAGCGGGSDGGQSSGTTAGSSAPSVSLAGATNDHGTRAASPGLAMEADDFYFEPTFVRATAGQRFTIEVENKGKTPHTFTSSGLGVDEQISPGERKTITVTAPATGSVEFHCRFHQSQGMQGAIFVG